MCPMTPDPIPDCAEVVRALWEYIDERMESADLSRIEDHLDRCEGCRAHAAFEERLVRTLAGLRKQHSDPERLREQVLKVLRDAGLKSEGSSSPAGD